MCWTSVGYWGDVGYLTGILSTLSRLADAVSYWALYFPQLVVLGEFNVYADTELVGAACEVIAFMAALGHSQVVSGPPYEGDHTLDLICCTGVDLSSLVKCEPMPHFLLRADLRFSTHLCTDREQIFAHPQRLMDPVGFWNALCDFSEPVGGSLSQLRLKIWSQLHHQPNYCLTPALSLVY